MSDEQYIQKLERDLNNAEREVAAMSLRVHAGENSDNCPFCNSKHQSPGVPIPMCHLCEVEADRDQLRAEVERLEEVARRQYWAMREGDNIVRHIRTLIFPGWTNLSDHDVNECLRAYEAEHGIAANYTVPEAQQQIDACKEAKP